MWTKETDVDKRHGYTEERNPDSHLRVQRDSDGRHQRCGTDQDDLNDGYAVCLHI